MSSFGRSSAAVAVGAALLATVTLSPSSARADGPVSPNGKGIVGGALLGAEVVDLGIAIGGVEKGWPYIVFGAVGAAGGGVGGYFAEKAVGTTGPVEAPVYMLAGGMALVIPTIVAVLNATSFKPPETERSEPVINQPVPEPPTSPKPGVGPTISEAKSARAATTPAADAPPRFVAAAPPARPHLPLSVVDVYDGHLALGVPAVEVRPVYTQREIAMFGVEQKTEVRIPVFQAVF
jgi:hypothetical protein